MKLSKILIICAVFLLSVIIGSAVKQDSITLNRPATGISTFLTNYTPGFNFTYYDADPSATYGVICYLYIDNQSNNFWIMNNWNQSYGNLSVPNNASKHNIMYMSHVFSVINSSNAVVAKNNTAFYWMIKCENATATPGAPWWAAGPRVIYQDVTTPHLNITAIGFTNNTWRTTSSVYVEVYGVDAYASGQAMTFYLKNDTAQTNNLGTATATTGAKVNITATLPDGDYTMIINVTSAAGKSNRSTLGDSIGNNFRLLVDATVPVISIKSPAANSVSTLGTILINWTIVEKNVSTIIFNWNGTDNTVSLAANCTGTAPNYNCFYNQSLVSYPNLYFNVFVNDSAGNTVRTANRSINSNQAGPQITRVYNFSVTAGTVKYNLTVSDPTPSSCKGRLFDWNNSYVTTLTGSVIADTVSTGTCYGTFSAADVVNEGAFKIQWNFTSSSGISNLSAANQTGVYKALAAGWNLFTMTSSNRSVGQVCSEIQNCTQVSIFSNSAQTYTTYSTSTSINSGTDVTPGTPILVYTTLASNWIGNDYLPTESDAINKYAYLYNSGWNHLGILKKANISAVYNAPMNGSLSLNISWAAKMDVSTGKLYTCRRSLGLCAGTSTNPTNISLPLGYAVYVLTDLQSNFSINRTEIRG